MTNVKAIEAKAMELNNDLEKVEKALKNVASRKCRWLKQPGRPDYAEKLDEMLREEQLLKQVRTYLTGPKKTVTRFEQDDVDQLTYDEAKNALKSIQSKKALTRWLTATEGDNDEFRSACRIEAMLKVHMQDVGPVPVNCVRKTEIQSVIDLIDMTSDISVAKIREMLTSLVNE